MKTRTALVRILLMLIVTSGVFASGAQEEEATRIYFQHIGGTVPAQEVVLESMVEDFEAENPGVKIVIVNVGWGEAYAQFQNQVAVGQAPDIVMLASQWSAEYTALGAFVPIDEYITQDVLDMFLPSGFDAVRGNGHVYGLPWDGSIWGFFYRKDLFQEAGLNPDAPPTNWDELLEYGKALTSGDRYGLAFPAAGWEPDDYFLPFLWQAGNDIVVKAGDVWKSRFDEVSARVASEYVYDLVHEHAIVPERLTGMDWEATMNSFIAGDVAMMYNGMWVANILKDYEDIAGAWTTAKSPVGPRGGAVMGYPNLLHITQQSENPRLAAEFIEFVFTRAAESGFTYYELYCVETGALGWTRNFSEIPSAADPIMKPFVDQVPQSRGRPLAPGYEQFRLLYFNPGIQSLITGDMQPDEFVNAMHARLNQLIGN